MAKCTSRIYDNMNNVTFTRLENVHRTHLCHFSQGYECFTGFTTQGRHCIFSRSVKLEEGSRSLALGPKFNPRTGQRQYV